MLLACRDIGLSVSDASKNDAADAAVDAISAFKSLALLILTPNTLLFPLGLAAFMTSASDAERKSLSSPGDRRESVSRSWPVAQEKNGKPYIERWNRVQHMASHMFISPSIVQH